MKRSHLSEHVMILFSNRLGCIGSVLVSIVATVVLTAVCSGFRF